MSPLDEPLPQHAQVGRATWRTKVLVALAAWVFVVSFVGGAWALKLRFHQTDERRQRQAQINSVQAAQLKVQRQQLARQRHVLAELCKTNTIFLGLVEAALAATENALSSDQLHGPVLQAVQRQHSSFLGYKHELEAQTACDTVARP